MPTHIWYYMPSSLYTEMYIRAKLLQSCLTLWGPMDCCLPGSSVHGILQARILKWVAMSSSGGSFPPRGRNCISCSSCIAGGFFTTEPPGKPLYVAFQSLSHVRLCDPMECSTTDFPVHHQLPELAQTHAHKLVMPSNHLILCHPLLLPSVFPSISVFSSESAFRIRWPKFGASASVLSKNI